MAVFKWMYKKMRNKNLSFILVGDVGKGAFIVPFFLKKKKKDHAFYLGQSKWLTAKYLTGKKKLTNLIISLTIT